MSADQLVKFTVYSTNSMDSSFMLQHHIPTVTGVLAFPTPITFLAATDTVYCCT